MQFSWWTSTASVPRSDRILLTLPPWRWTRSARAAHLRRTQDPVEIGPHRDPVMAIEGRELAVRGTCEMRGETSGVPGGEGLKEQGRQHEVVGPEAVRRETLVCRVHVVDLGQHDKAERRGETGHPLEEGVDLGLDHEAGRSRLLDHVPDCIEPDHPDPMAREVPQPTGDERFGGGRGHVEVDLLRPVGGPE